MSLDGKGASVVRRQRLRQRRAAVAAVAVLGLGAALLAGCSGNNDSDGSSSSTSKAVDLSVLGDKKPATGAPVKIGLFNIEGGTAVDSPEIGDGARAAADYANEYLGGLGGHKIEIVRCGDKGDGASAAACANKFVQARVAAVVVGQPATADQIVPVIQGAKIPWISASPSAPTEFAYPGATFFSSGFLGLLASQAVYAKQKGWKRVTMLGTENPQLVATLNSIGKPLFKGQGVTLDFVPVPHGTADAGPQVTAATQSKPDALVIAADAAGCQAVFSAMTTLGATQPKMVNNACVAQPVVDAVGEAGIDKTVLFMSGDPVGDHEEAQLYRAIMQQYAPDVEETGGITPLGYQSMLGFVRALNADSATSGDVTPETVTAAIKKAKNLPLPMGNGETFSCDVTQFPVPTIKATICNSKYFVTTYSGTKAGPYETVDAAAAFRG
ncbi:ABC transporter substrate-binding protein [Cryptosporangium aurantiacum]|uniref:ABC transporter substrate-binding protein n=1 Tax=Cryptosporangium aurantiacum TaxID=134849 RepID=UPI0009FF0A38|nr:ABC transporter substrate-binding protein [Cryptosporangium aurantiacum]